ncbi:hypothetical protein [Kiloniella sp. b19]|uniref:hypothetical protein n=1 Tax=Kiloniella sp. GXU_MW_B19 TaxID=3141326 RepID=UPI0031D2DD80
MKILSLLAFALLLSGGQILFKKAAESIDWAAGLLGFLNLWFVSAVMLYAFSTLLWVWILRTVPLNYAYPFTALAFLVVPVLSVFLLREEWSWHNTVSAFLILLGIVVLSLKKI